MNDEQSQLAAPEAPIPAEEADIAPVTETTEQSQAEAVDAIIIAEAAAKAEVEAKVKAEIEAEELARVKELSAKAKYSREFEENGKKFKKFYNERGDVVSIEYIA
jgi:hypothetical protein